MDDLCAATRTLHAQVHDLHLHTHPYPPPREHLECGEVDHTDVSVQVLDQIANLLGISSDDLN
jgi:hypothetical protein